MDNFVPNQPQKQQNRQSQPSSYQYWDNAPNWQYWENWPGHQDQRPNTPKKERKASRSQNRDRDSSKGKGKGKQKSGKGKRPPQEEPVWKSDIQVPNAPKKPQQPAQAPANPEAAQLAKLLQALKSSGESLAPEVQEVIKEVDIVDCHASKKQLHSVVNQISNSRRAMAETAAARAQLHMAWKSFLTDAVTRWEAYMTDFAAQDESLAEQFTKAQQEWEAAKTNFRVTKRSLDVSSKDDKEKEEEDAHVISDADEMEGKSEEDTKIKEGINNMTTALQSLKKQSETIAAESEQAAKRQKLEGGGSSSLSASNFGKGALQPFR